MKYLNIKEFDVANGLGVRTSLFVTGCRHACPGCFNLIAQNPDVGEEFTDEVIEYIIDTLRPSFMTGLTLLGGEPMDPNNQPSIRKLIERFREEFGWKKDIWSWTGYVYPRDFNPMDKRNRAFTEHTDVIMDNLDILIDGPFIQQLASPKLMFRGSANQRIINMKETRQKHGMDEGNNVYLDVGEDPLLVGEIMMGIRKKED